VKIVDVCAFYSPQGGGVRTYIDQKLEIGPSLGHEIVIIAPGEEDRTEVRRGSLGRIEWLASPRLPLDSRYRYFKAGESIARSLARERPDFIEASSPWRSAAVVAAWSGRTPSALVMHSDPLASYAYRWLEGIASVGTIDRGLDWAWRYLRNLAGRFDLVVSASQGLSARLRNAGLTNLATHPMGVQPGLFSPGLRDPALRARMLRRCALDENAALLIAVGRLAPEKRWPMVIQAVARACSEKPVGLLLVGDGRERSRVVREIGGNPHVHLLSPLSRPDLARLMASCDALIHGCEAETFSMAAAEAAASGLPIIAPDRGGAADHALGAGGFCYRAGDPADAALAILECLRRARAPGAVRHRTIDDHFRELFAHYQSLAQISGQAA
jgi:alpha-1,6-mannosyltransferase